MPVQCRFFTVILVSALSSCGGDEDSAATLLVDPTAEFPLSYAETGLVDLSEDTPTHRVFSFEPAFPLFSNALQKERLLALPEGEKISHDETTGDWVFPLGTLFIKRFSDADGRVETRVIRNTTRGWEYASYRGEESAAPLVDPRLGQIVDVNVGIPGAEHAIPAVPDCKSCHEAFEGRTPILGFSQLQLADVQNGDALAALMASEIFDFTPNTESSLPETDEATGRVLGFFAGNCAHCHRSPAALELTPQQAVTEIVNQESEGSASAAGIRVVPGSPEESLLFQAVSGETDNPDVLLMPPLGAQLRDEASIEALREWIQSL